MANITILDTWADDDKSFVTNKQTNTMVTIKVRNWAKYKYNMNVEWIANVVLFYR